MKKVYVRVEGIYCGHCVHVIEEALEQIENVRRVRIRSSIAAVEYEGELDNEIIIETIQETGYSTREEWQHYYFR